ARRQLLRSDHHHWNNENNAHIPFNVNNKTTLAIKMMAFTATGFGIPFFLTWWTL
ncbi:cytochrome c oxidase subunit VIIc, partial [Dimargaris cristalligena]